MIIIRTLRKDIANYNREDDIVRNFTQSSNFIYRIKTLGLINHYFPKWFLSVAGKCSGKIYLEPHFLTKSLWRKASANGSM